MARRYGRASSPHNSRQQPLGQKRSAEGAGQPGEQSPYAMIRQRGAPGQMVAIIILSVACVVMFIVLMITLAMLSTSDRARASSWKENKDLKEAKADLQAEVRELRAKLLAAGESPGLDAETGSPSRSKEFYYLRTKELESELYALKQAAAYYKAHIPKHVEENMLLQQDVVLEDIKIQSGPNGIRVVFVVKNQAGRRMRNVTGNIRFWRGSKIVHESPFRIPMIPARTTQRMYVDVPPIEYTDYSGHVKAGQSY